MDDDAVFSLLLKRGFTDAQSVNAVAQHFQSLADGIFADAFRFFRLDAQPDQITVHCFIELDENPVKRRFFELDLTPRFHFQHQAVLLLTDLNEIHLFVDQQIFQVITGSPDNFLNRCIAFDFDVEVHPSLKVEAEVYLVSNGLRINPALVSLKGWKDIIQCGYQNNQDQPAFELDVHGVS